MSDVDWNFYKIDEIKSKADNAITIGPFGSRMKAELYKPSGIPVIRGNNISSSKLLSGDFVYISEETANKLKSCIVFPDDLVFPHRGAIGLVGIVPKDRADKYILSSSLMKLSCNKEIVDPHFLFYFFRSPTGKFELLKNASTVGTPGIATPLASLKSIEILIPSIITQIAIAHILGTLDDKIELNRRMNETLEAIARAIFKSWFIDFDPVRAKAEGRQPEGMDTETAALFPSEFEVVDGQEIPKGWEIEKIGNIIELAYGKALKEENRVKGSIPVFGSNGLIGWHNEIISKGPGIIIGRKGNPGVIKWSSTDFFAIDTTFYVIPKNNFNYLHYLRFSLESQNLATLGADSAVPGLNRNQVYMSRIIKPDANILKKFNNLLTVFDHNIQNNLNQSRTLSSLRDTLLPKLLSGELQIDKPEQFCESLS